MYSMNSKDTKANRAPKTRMVKQNKKKKRTGNRRGSAAGVTLDLQAFFLEKPKSSVVFI